VAADENEADGGGREDASQTPNPIYNWQSAIGAMLAAIGVSVAAFLVLIDLATPQATGYAGLALLPPVLLAGFGGLLILTGWTRERRRQRRGERSSFFDQWVVDPFGFVQRTSPMLIVAVVASLTLGLLSMGAGTVAVVEFSESNTFCGSVCHQVMGPEAIAHKETAHSQIACVKCHVGGGAEGFLEAKIGGLRQLWALASGTVQRPIPTPIHGGIINRTLCETCHTLERAASYKALTRSYFLNGMEDVPVELTMLLKTGGSADEVNGGRGIHYHMQIARVVEYIARDRQRQEIAWVRITDADGEIHEYSNSAAPLTEEEKVSLEVRRMECIDCHSRPAHAFQSPIDLVNSAIDSELLPPDLAYIKEAAVRALDGEYADAADARSGIERTVREYYENEDPDVLEERAEDIAGVIEDLKAIYERTMFPEMKALWSTHPNNIGHRDSPGCFRCHNDEMVDRDGTPVFTQCSKCHTILAQDDQAIQNIAEFEAGMGFVHPEDGGSFDEFSLCSDCHTGGKELFD
jgi:hypothetical protein